MTNSEEKDIKNQIKNEDRFEVFYALSLVFRLGVSIAFVVGFFLYTGIYLDKLLGTGIILSVTMLVFSIPCSVYIIYRLLEPIIGSEKRKNFLKKKK